MNRFMQNLKDQAEQNPILALGVAAALVTTLSKLMDANASRMNAKSWNRETARRAMKDRSR
jgi:hypothetical protein